jgi:hypothetical protein
MRKRITAAAIIAAAALSGCGPSPEEKAAQEKKQIAFCRNVLDVISPTDKTCGRFYAELIAEKKANAQKIAEAMEELPSKCKKYIGELMGREPSSMTTNYENPSDSIVGISYARQDDGKIFKYECTTKDGSIIWRGIDIFYEGEGAGRWRTEDARPISSL